MGSASSLGSESRASTFLSDEDEEILGEDILTPMKGPGKVCKNELLHYAHLLFSVLVIFR